MSALALTWRLERRLFWRNPSAAFFNFLLPLLFLGLFGAVFSSDQQQLDVIVPGIAGLSVMSTTFSALALLWAISGAGRIKARRMKPAARQRRIERLRPPMYTN